MTLLVNLAVYLLAVYGLAWSLVEAEGPWNVLDRFRHWAGVRYDTGGSGMRYGVTVAGKALNCPVCTSYWVSVPLLLLLLLLPVLLYPLAAVGFVTLLTEAFNGDH